ncbi:MAG: hypothetical protein H0U74_06520 [Bradymonadaceae bacterium]|nr:hypothetical protein [Lujinxingiaceae bacterium]
MNHFIYFGILSTFVLSCACGGASQSTLPADAVELAPVVKSVAEDPLSLAERWLQTGPEAGDALWEQVESWNNPRVSRLFLAGEGRYHALVSPAGEPADAGAIRLVIARDTGGQWQIVSAEAVAARGLWPRL